jgi:hypothetical protein
MKWRVHHRIVIERVEDVEAVDYATAEEVAHSRWRNKTVSQLQVEEPLSVTIYNAPLFIPENQR